MANVDLNDTDIWDDSALIQSWNGALEEYKRYHSIHARGEKVEDVLQEHELAELRGLGDLNSSKPEEQVENGVKSSDLVLTDDRDEPELPSIGDDHIGTPNRKDTPKPPDTQPKNSAFSMAASGSVPFGPSAPAALLGSVNDEALKNLIMAWYYAGYYTGFYEGRLGASQLSSHERNRKAAENDETGISGN